MSTRVTTYRKFLGPWGLLVTLRASASFNSPPKDPAEIVSDGIHLHIMDPYATEEDKHFLAFGMRMVAGSIRDSCPHEVITVQVLELDYLPTDYQPEAAAAAIIAWSVEEFGIPSPVIDVSFDRSTGYSFTWPTPS